MARQRTKTLRRGQHGDDAEQPPDEEGESRDARGKLKDGKEGKLSRTEKNGRTTHADDRSGESKTKAFRQDTGDE